MPTANCGVSANEVISQAHEQLYIHPDPQSSFIFRQEKKKRKISHNLWA